MCGISLLLSTSAERPAARDEVERMNRAQWHRGPDGEGIEVCQAGGVSVALGHRRLSIIDLAGGTQPMSNEDDTVWITYNGEIYNHAELRKELEAKGHRYKTRSDTETIIHAYEEWGSDCVQRLRGMFAFAIWDGNRRELFAVRDRMGIKPFYYVVNDETLLCASEIKGIVSSGRHAAAINRRAVPEFVTFGYIAGEETLFDGVKKLLPGHYLHWKDGQVRTKQYWEIPAEPTFDESKTEADYIDEFTSIFEESVSLRLMSDVPLGIFLSGGLDSSAIAATMAKQMSDPLMTFSVGFDAQYYSEFKYARQVAERIGADHQEIILKPEGLFGSLPELVWHEDEPIRNPSSIALYNVAKLSREHVKVVLTGEGSDELFAGYSRYWATMFNQRWGSLYERVLPRMVRERWIRDTLWKWPLPAAVRQKLSHTFLYHAQRPEEIIFDNFHAILPQRVHEAAFSPEFYAEVRDVDPYAESVRLYRNRRSREELDRLLYTDQKTYLVELLMKQDTMSMATSIESRVPFLDHHMVEFATRVPPRFKLNKESEKYLVKKSIARLVPESILTREKMGFPVPLKEWIREGFSGALRSILLSERTKERNVFNPQFVERLLDENVRRARNHTDALWTILNFELWARVYVDGESHQNTSDELMAHVAAPAAAGVVMQSSPS
ncbi:MAG: asparagine synthase (glutamine-hydrolyzing) [Planctomycetota bacterium]|nr:MAG: asparagine synthase (glutamine-hydrolyzing) [Planctomycetota bacterium]REK43595.1 MAG: asparagine synthase (glutamine-hydrolyzing) [Planctomycetota bacterium]